MDNKNEIELKQNPIIYNELYQIQAGYPGLDILEVGEIKENELFAIVELPKELSSGGDYFMQLKELHKYGLDAQGLCDAYQIGPYFNEEENPYFATYKPIVRVYMANEDLLVAIGITSANPQYGSGGAVQMVRPFGKNEIKEADLDINCKLHHPILPIDLNNKEMIDKLPDKFKKVLLPIIEKNKNSITKDGSFYLKNTKINSYIYRIIENKKKLHENIKAQISLLYEYNNELKSSSRNINYIKKLKDDLINLEHDNKYIKRNLLGYIKQIKKNPSLTKSIIDKYKKHLLDPSNYCLDEHKKMLDYSKSKMKYLESNLSKREKKKININGTLKGLFGFKVNNDLESKIDSLYSHITNEGQIIILGYRNRIYKPYCETIDEAILWSLNKKYEFTKLLNSTNNIEIKKLYKKYIDCVNKTIEKFNNKKTEYGLSEKHTWLSNPINYLEQSIVTQNKGSSENKLIVDNVTKVIEAAKNNPLIDFEYFEKLNFELYELLSVEKKIEEQHTNILEEKDIISTKESNVNAGEKEMDAVEKMFSKEPEMIEKYNKVKEEKILSDNINIHDDISR